MAGSGDGAPWGLRVAKAPAPSFGAEPPRFQGGLVWRSTPSYGQISGLGSRVWTGIRGFGWDSPGVWVDGRGFGLTLVDLGGSGPGLVVRGLGWCSGAWVGGWGMG